MALTCTPDTLTLRVDWISAETPTQDWSVFVHLLDSGGALLTQADQSAPVYGWRPTSTWLPGEIVRDFYTLPHLPEGQSMRFGLYRQLPDGTFENRISEECSIICEGE
jgi:hypothetical protein